jgi:hypothetical protein
VRRRWIGSALVAVLIGTLIAGAPSIDDRPAEAANASDLDPGMIISDELFYDGAAMSESEIQRFLENAVGGRCDNSNCLAAYRADTPTRTWSFGTCSTYHGGSGESAARIIFKVQQACKLSAKVILVTLQKEQSLVTNRAPSDGVMRKAMGYGCPDTASCDSTYYGFFNQIFAAGRQLTWYGNPQSSFTNIKVGQVNAIRYHPNAACGTKDVLVKNRATAALYYYTPYTPNAAALGNLYGVGDGCSAYGNRNFWRMYVDWFGSTSAPLFGSLDSAVGVRGGIQISGWSIDPKTTGTSYIWVNVDGVGGPYLANKPRSWFNALFPGYGPNHGFDEFIPAAPGTREVCVHGTSQLLRCVMVDVPYGSGSFDSAVGVWGGVEISGWSVDFGTTAPSYIWVNVDGVGGPHRAGERLSWFNALYPNAGLDHGFKTFVSAPPGAREVCVYGNWGPVSRLISCKTVDVPRGQGSFDSLTAVPGGLMASGWFADRTTPERSWLWVNVDGKGGPYGANSTRSWLPNLLPGIGAGNGFDLRLPARQGSHEVCVYGADKLVGCKTATVAFSADGSLDAAEGVPGGIRVRGWSIDLTTLSTPSYIWVNIDGVGGPQKANQPLSWFDGHYPGAGPNHGFDVTIPASSGRHEVCVHGTEKLLGCQVVTVP